MATTPEEPRTDTEKEQASRNHYGEEDTPSPNHEDQEEGGPVKTFLEHLEDLRWVLIKSLVAVGLGMLICLVAGSHVMNILQLPLKRAKIRYAGPNQVWTINWGTNRLGVFKLTDEQQTLYAIGTNRFVQLNVDLIPTGTNFVVTLTPDLRGNPVTALPLPIELKNYTPVGGFYVALQLALYGGLVLASPFVFYFVVGFIFPALRMREK